MADIPLRLLDCLGLDTPVVEDDFAETAPDVDEACGISGGLWVVRCDEEDQAGPGSIPR